MRTVTILGPSQSGKTTLISAMSRLDAQHRSEPFLADGGAVRVQQFSWLGEDWTAIEVAGGADHLAHAGPALAASDAAVICVPPEADAAVLSAPYLRLVESAHVPCLIFVNRMDSATERVRDIVAALQVYSSHHIILRQIPIREGGRIVGAVDLISERAWHYEEGRHSSLIQMPEELRPREEEARTELLESLADFDDALLEQLIEDQQPMAEEIYHTATAALQHGDLVEAFLGSAEHSNGVTRLMKSLRHEAPDHHGAAVRLGAPALAVSAVGDHAKHLGKVVMLRALDAGVAPGQMLAGSAIGSLTALDARSQIGALEPGDIALAVKSDHLAVGQSLTGKAASPLPGWAAARPPALRRIFRPASDRDEARLSGALQRLVEVDPGLTLTHDEMTGDAVLGLQGPLHERNIVARLAEAFGIETTRSNVTPPYRETISGQAQHHHRHRKQSGGAGQFADVVIRLRALPRGQGVVFDEEVKGGAVPKRFIPAVEAGVREALRAGPGGFPVVDIAVTLLDGKHHEVDSSDHAFRTAGRNAVREALAEMGTQILQPIVSVAIHVPSTFSGGLVSVISGLKGQVLGFEAHPEATGWDVFNALLPMSAEEGLSRALGSLTRGTAWFETTFDHYEPCRKEDIVVQEVAA